MNAKHIEAAPAAMLPAGQTVVETEATGKREQMTRLDWEIEIFIRLGTALLLSPFFIMATRAFLHDRTRLTLIVMMFTESVTLLYAICTRVPRKRDWNPLSMFLAFCATYYLLAFTLRPGIHLIPEWLAAGIQMAGFLIALWAKLSLRRSFGILPANRGVVASGIYQFIRHPMYCGYFVRDLGFLLPNFGWQNLLVVLLHWSLQTGRIIREERVLVQDPVYRRYAEKVRYRVLPGVF